MILRRFMKHVTEQNWIAVGLDIIVVIVGIFLGMQVTEWNEQRKGDILQKQYLEKLLSDVGHSLVKQRQEIEIMQRQIESGEKALSRLFEQSLSEESMDEFSQEYKDIYSWQKASLITGTLEEIFSTGRLSLFQSNEVRTAIIYMRQSYELNNTVNDNLGQLMMDRTAVLDAAVTLTPDRSKIVMTTSQITENPIIYNTINSVVDYHRAVLSMAKHFNQQTNRFHDALDEELKKRD